MSNKPPTLAFDLEHDVQILSAMASNLTPYLYENEMYGYLSGDLPKLTLGGLLLRLYRLSRLDDILNAEEHNIVQDARINFEAERSKWAVHYEAKLLHELTTRVDALERFLAECGEELRQCAADYPIQAEKRTIIEHLFDESTEHDIVPDELPVRLKQLDQKLRRLFAEGEFISDKRLEEVYPRNQFWWLYGYIAEERP
jgi:hypothetical protein